MTATLDYANLHDLHGNAFLLAMAFANSPTFQEHIGKFTEADALSRIHLGQLIIERDASGDPVIFCEMRPPRIIIASELGNEDYTVQYPGMWSLHETFWVSFDFFAPEDVASADQCGWMQSLVRKILKDVRDLATTGQVTGTQLAYPIIRPSRIEGPYFIDVAETTTDPEEDSPEHGTLPPICHMAYEIERGF